MSEKPDHQEMDGFTARKRAGHTMIYLVCIAVTVVCFFAFGGFTHKTGGIEKALAESGMRVDLQPTAPLAKSGTTHGLIATISAIAALLVAAFVRMTHKTGALFNTLMLLFPAVSVICLFLLSMKLGGPRLGVIGTLYGFWLPGATAGLAAAIAGWRYKNE